MADEQKKALVEQLDRQRGRIAGRYQSLQQELNPGYQLKQSVWKHPGRWAAASAGTAFLVTRLLRPKKVISNEGGKKRGLLVKTGKFIFTLARPALTAFVVKQAQEYAEAKLGHDPDNSMLGGPSQK